jgi:UDP-glucose 4-epimerase
VKNLIIVTGGAGFVGSNLIKHLISKTNDKIVSLDNYSSGSKKNHIKSKRVKYLKGDTEDIEKIIGRYAKRISVLFHFGEFSRIHQSFIDIEKCINTNISGTSKVFNFCLKNKIKIIYSATSASLGNKGIDQNLSPYSFTKSKNLKLLINFSKWFGISYEVLYFYNVYGQGHIVRGPMATVIGIFEEQYRKNKALTVVKPGTQSRKFTHIDDTVNGCFYAWRQNKNRHYSLSSAKSYTIKEVAKMYSKKIKFINKKLGERNQSAIVRKIGDINIYSFKCNKKLNYYIENFKKELNY